MLHLAHANGFPPGTYRRLAARLVERFRVVAVTSRPLAGGERPEELSGWQEMSAELLAGLGAHGLEEVVGVGHSLGGVLTLAAAATEPARFRAVVLVDPVVFTGLRSVLWAAAKAAGLGSAFPLVRSALRRRDRWPDRATVRRAWAAKPVFSRWAEGVLDDYVDAGLESDPSGGLRLAYPKDWEARIFTVTPHDVWPAVRRLEVPALVLRGAGSDTLTAAAAARFARECPRARVETVPETSHFLPMERPEEVARRILAFVDDLRPGAR